MRQSRTKVFVGRILSRITPTLRLRLGSPVESLSTDAAWVETSLKDPHFYKTLSARIAIEQLKANEWILTQSEFPLPLLIQQGTADRYVDPEVNIAFARRLQGNVTLKVWEGLAHELHNERIQREVMAFVCGWLEERISGCVI